jgi:tripartite-type tricarboxylate transporter receptor subunit TctC
VNARGLIALVFVLAPGVGALLQSSDAAAQAWPQHPVKLIVPWGAGGITDALGRFLAQPLGERLGQQVVIDNRGGGGGTVGSAVAAAAPADGYTLLVASIESYGTTQAERRRLPYDPERAYAPVALVARGANVVVVHPSVKATSLREFIELARARPGSIRYCSAGVGSNAHVTMEMLQRRTGVQMIHVPYKSGGAAIADIVSGEIEMCIIGTTAVASRVKSGQLRALAIASASRVSMMPEVPAMAESGLGDVVLAPVYGVVAPAGTAPEIVARLAREVAAVNRSPDFRARMAEIGMEPMEPISGAEFGRFMSEESRRWREVAAQSGLVEQ